MNSRIPMGPQGRELRRRLTARTCAIVAAYTVCYLVFLLIVNLVGMADLAERVADATSEWIYLTEEQYRVFQESNMGGDGRYWDVWPTEEGTFGVRDLTTYYAIKSLKVPVAFALYCIGLVAILLAMLNRSVRYFNELSYAVARLLEDKSTVIDLSSDLHIVASELSGIRERSLADDRAAEAAEARKNELVAYLAHDIKTPLTSIIGYLQLLDDEPDLPVEARSRYAGVALDKARRLDAMMDEFFEITRYNMKTIPIERQKVDMFILCSQAADEVYPLASNRNICVDVQTSGNRDAFIDPDKLARVLSNVLRNAISYADQDSTVSMRLEGCEKEMVLCVENRGREISPEHLDAIFEKFFREDGARATEKGGAGLGLAIAKEIVTAHGGSISAESENGATAFTIRLPRSPL